MLYCSTRNHALSLSAAEAIVQGISEEGGLFVPQSFPEISSEELKSLAEKSYTERAVVVLSKFLTDFTQEEIKECVEKAYSAQKFSSSRIAPVAPVGERYLLELWHGPTCAFKDMALQLLPLILKKSAEKVLPNKQVAILVATSGDTGKAALEGFRDVSGTQVFVFYPADGVSSMQKLQMVTQRGKNVHVCAIHGNFDDAQREVKSIFTSRKVIEDLSARNVVFSSANSINWGRLAPQIVYYFSAYCDLLQAGAIQNGDPINVAVPTGNFGNILAAYYAKKMHLPIQKLICASNSNNVLTEFIQTGKYNRNRPFYATISPSMDILISSNLERLLYDLSGRDDAYIAGLYQQLERDGICSVDDRLRAKIQDEFYGGYCDDEQTKRVIKEVFEKEHYLCDTHTAVAIHVCDQYRRETKDSAPCVVASTANAYKFPSSVLSALGEEPEGGDFEQIERLARHTKTVPPAPLLALKDSQVRFSQVIDREHMKEYILQSFAEE